MPRSLRSTTPFPAVTPEKFDGLFGVKNDGDGHDQNGGEQLGLKLVPTWIEGQLMLLKPKKHRIFKYLYIYIYIIYISSVVHKDIDMDGMDSLL